MDYTNLEVLTERIKDAVHLHLPLALALMVFGGILSAISPASIPRMVAIANYAGRETKRFWHAVGLALAFGTGICLVYALVGMVAGSFGILLSLTGALYYVTAGLCLLMGLSMIRLFHINWSLGLPTVQKVGHGYLGAFALGVGFAFLVAPDAVPIMVGALTVTTFQGEIGLGALLMFAFGIGHGIPVLFAGALAPWYSNNPIARKWHVAAEMAAGYVLVFLAIFFTVIA